LDCVCSLISTYYAEGFLDKAETDLKDAQVAAVGSIYKRASTTMDGTATLRDMQGDLGGKDIEIRVSLDNSKIPPSSM
jgi:hypothetical protein